MLISMINRQYINIERSVTKLIDAKINENPLADKVGWRNFFKFKSTHASLYSITNTLQRTHRINICKVVNNFQYTSRKSFLAVVVVFCVSRIVSHIIKYVNLLFSSCQSVCVGIESILALMLFVFLGKCEHGYEIWNFSTPSYLTHIGFGEKKITCTREYYHSVYSIPVHSPHTCTARTCEKDHINQNCRFKFRSRYVCQKFHKIFYRT